MKNTDSVLYTIFDMNLCEPSKGLTSKEVEGYVQEHIEEGGEINEIFIVQDSHVIIPSVRIVF